MYYLLLYQITVYNPLGSKIIIDLAKKYFPPDPPVDVPATIQLRARSFVVSYPEGSENKYQPIIACQAEIVIRVTASIPIDHYTFVSDEFDTWRVTARLEDVEIFRGYVVNEVKHKLKAKPYDVTIKAIDGLGLLKDIPLTDFDGIDFVGRNSLAAYISGCLAKTNLDIPFRIYCSIYESSMLNRYDGMQYDMFTQAKLHHRTFLKEPGEFAKCYEALEIILKDFCSLYYWMGRWVISTRMELIGPNTNFWTEYLGATGNAVTILDFDQDLTANFPIGKDRRIEPIDLSLFVSYQFPVKSVKTFWNYVIPPDLVNNEKMQFLGAFISPLSGPLYSAWEMVGWGQFNFTTVGQTSTEVAYAGGKNAYIKSEVDAFGYEIDRYYVIEYDPAVLVTNSFTTANYIRNLNSDFFVDKGDGFSFSFTTRTKDDAGGHRCCSISLLKLGRDGTDPDDWMSFSPTDGGWFEGASFPQLAFFRTAGDSTEWVTLSSAETTIPEDGNLYIYFHTGNIIALNEAHFKDMEITYTPIVKGSKLPIKSDFWFTSQNANIKDILDEEVFISDSPKRLLKGGLWREDGITLTTPTWYRLNTAETRHFKELLNLGVYRHNYRNIMRVEGSLRGDMYEETPTVFNPLSFHKHFTFIDDMGANRFFVLVPPLTIDYGKGKFTAVFKEVYYKPDPILPGVDSYTEGDSHYYNYKF